VDDVYLELTPQHINLLSILVIAGKFTLEDTKLIQKKFSLASLPCQFFWGEK